MFNYQQAMQAPDLQLAHAQLPAVLRLLTQISLESMAGLIPEGEDGDELLADHFERVSMLCSQVQLDADKMNPRWNKAYGEGGTNWSGALQDQRNRGGIPYHCPRGWVRFALNVCPDDEFEERFAGWGYLYHGTKGRFVGPILTSGLRASKGLCFCGKDDHAVYMSPSIEYCGHPRYSSIEYNPETRKWIQVILQCRVDPKLVWKIQRETLHCEEFEITVDEYVSNESLEWLFKPNYTDPASGDKYIQDAIVCTGIMIRATDVHPMDLPYWWSNNQAYVERCRLRQAKVDPLQKPLKDQSWTKFENTTMGKYTIAKGDPSAAEYEIKGEGVGIGTTWLSPAPFANGSMRNAWYLQTERGMYVVKLYNDETKRHIQSGLGITLDTALARDATTYLAAQYYAKKLVSKYKRQVGWNWDVNFVEPHAFRLGDEWWFGELHLAGRFVKWNTNTGENNMSPEAGDWYLNEMAAFFTHFTYVASKGNLMVVDIQGLVNDDTSSKKKSVTLMDPQIHTRTFNPGTKDRKQDRLYKRFSVGNLGKTGMIRFFANHVCNASCKKWGFTHPMDESAKKLELNLME